MENNPREQELDFLNSSQASGAVPENAEILPENTLPLPETPEECPVNNAAAEAPVVNNAANDEMPFLRSRCPMNRPARTPPLEENIHPAAVNTLEAAIAGKSYGAALRTLREYSNVDYQELDRVTKIQPRYLEALENENLDALPPLVYVIGFIRSLARYYQLSDTISDQMVAELKDQLEYACNDDIINSLDVDSSGAEANVRKLKRIVMSFAAVAVIAVILIVAAVLLVRSWNKPAAEAPVKPVTATEKAGSAKFDPNTIYPLLEPPALDLPKLPVAE